MTKRKRPTSRDSTLTPPPDETGSPSPGPIPNLATLPDLEPYRLPLSPGEVYYIPNFLSLSAATEAYNSLLALDTWEHPFLKVYGKVVRQSRASTVYATNADVEMKYSGADVTVHSPMPPIVEEMRGSVEKLVGDVGVCMLNRYDGGEVYIGKHSDTPDNEVIASVSLGAERTFVFSPREPGKGSVNEVKRVGKRENLRIKLASGSLVIMAGETQSYWKHEIPKELRVKEGRISLTFRRLKKTDALKT